MANVVYSRGQYIMARGRVTTSATYTLALVSTGYTADMNHNTFDDGTTSDPDGYEISVAGYARATLASVTLTEDDTNDMACLDAADTTFGNLTAGQTIGGAVIYIYSTSGGTTSDTGQDLLSYYALTATPTNGGALTIQWAATTNGGFLKIGTTS